VARKTIDRYGHCFYHNTTIYIHLFSKRLPFYKIQNSKKAKSIQNSKKGITLQKQKKYAQAELWLIVYLINSFSLFTILYFVKGQLFLKQVY